MYINTIQPSDGRPLSFPRLDESHQAAILRLYFGLDKESLWQRFGGYLSQEAVGAYVHRLLASDTVILGAVSEGELFGICEAIPLGLGRGVPVTELAFAVAPHAQGKRVGFQLGQEAMQTIVGRLVLACATQNPSMAKLALKLGFKRLREAEDDQALTLCLFEELQTGYGIFSGPGVACG